MAGDLRWYEALLLIIAGTLLLSTAYMLSYDMELSIWALAAATVGLACLFIAGAAILAAVRRWLAVAEQEQALADMRWAEAARAWAIAGNDDDNLDLPAGQDAGSWHGPLNSRASRMAQENVIRFVRAAWEESCARGDNPAMRASGLARELWCGNDGPESLCRRWYDAACMALSGPLAVVAGRRPGAPGRFSLDQLEDVEEMIRVRWDYVSSDDGLMEILAASLPSQVAQVPERRHK